MVTFLRSKLYLNFWLFILKSAFTVGVLSALDVFILAAPTHLSRLDELAMVSLTYFFFASLIGFLVAISSFVGMYFYLKLRPEQSLRAMAYTLGSLVALITLSWYVRSFQVPARDAFLFPVLPMVIAIFAFKNFTEAHLNAEARSARAPATVKGIF